MNTWSRPHALPGHGSSGEPTGRIVTAFRRFGSLLPERLKSELKLTLGIPNVRASLLNVKRLGFDPRLVIDVGAYRGEWTRMVKDLFPAARVLMIEPQNGRREALEALCGKYEGVSFCDQLLGATDGASVRFREAGSGSSALAPFDQQDRPWVNLTTSTLAAVTRNTRFERPDFVKIDVQGYELEVLKGGREVVARAEAILIEVDLIEIYDGAPPFREVVDFLGDCGFRLYDVCQFFRRPFDHALWQMDVLFVASWSHLIASKRWHRTT